MNEPDRPIAGLLPQAPPMVLLDRVAEHRETGLTAEVTVRRDDRFFTPGHGIGAQIGIEWMAQACAAFAGWTARRMGLPVKLGFLLGTRGYEADRAWFTEHEVARVSVEQVFEEDGMAVFDCGITVDGVSRARARLTVYQPADPAAVLGGIGSA
jgi:predicted hotdog family 3-hydroxylacyl-ACP dehydratase